MPLYDYRCRVCEETFELRRSIGDADRDVACPQGHTDAARLLPVFAATGRSGGGAAPAPATGGGGGCCGGGCGCR